MRAILLTSLLAGCQMTPQQWGNLGNVGAGMISQQPAYSPSYRPAALFQGERVSGMNKLCFYSRVGSAEAITIPATGICPLQIP